MFWKIYKLMVPEKYKYQKGRFFMYLEKRRLGKKLIFCNMSNFDIIYVYLYIELFNRVIYLFVNVH